MGEIYVEGLGIVQIKGDTPTDEESAAIAGVRLPAAKPTPRAAGSVADDPASDVGMGVRGIPSFTGAQPTQRGAERSSMDALNRQMPEVNQMLANRGGLEDVTGGYVNRPALTALGATAGGAVGAATGPAGMLAGSTLGAAGGSLVFDTLDEAVRHFKGTGRDKDPLAPAKTAASEARDEFLFTGGASALGPIFRRFAPAVGKVLGLGGSKEVADKAAGMRVPLGAIQATESKAVKGVSRVMGVFPLLNKPYRSQAEASARGLDAAYDDLLDTVAPTATLTDLGVDLTKAAQERYGKFRRVTAALYDRFNTLADNATVKDIVPTQEVAKVAKEMADAASEGQIKLRSGEILQAVSGNPVDAFIQQLTDLPDRLTVRQARQLQRDLSNVMGKAQSENLDVARAMKIKSALERDFNNPAIDLLPPEEGREIIKALERANGFFAEAIQRFESPTAQRFGRVDRKMFEVGRFEPGNLNADEVMTTVFRAKSPQALADLRDLVGPQKFREAGRRFLENAFSESATRNKGTLSFEPERFTSMLGLDTPEGRKSLATILEGSGVDIKQLDDFAQVAKAAGSFTVPDTSIFLQRRFTLGGLKNVLGGVAMGAVGISNPVMTVAGILLARKAGAILTSPENLRAMTRVLDDTLPMQQRRALLIRVGRAVLDGEESSPPATRMLETTE